MNLLALPESEPVDWRTCTRRAGRGSATGEDFGMRDSLPLKAAHLVAALRPLLVHTPTGKLLGSQGVGDCSARHRDRPAYPGLRPHDGHFSSADSGHLLAFLEAFQLLPPLTCPFCSFCNGSNQCLHSHRTTAALRAF